MNILLVGSGAREHALAWKLAGERHVSEIVCAPGNAGIASLARCLPIDPGDPAAILALADRERIDFTIVGPELPLARGAADRFADAGALLFGPSAAAARLESSKAFAKAFMHRHGVPTAESCTCDNVADAVEVIRSGRLGWPLVVKADGLAAGKGVVVAEDRRAAEEAAHAAMVDGRFGSAGSRLVLEECLRGREASFFAIVADERAVPFGTAEDHKRVFDDDQGPNTGGMGAFAPSPCITPDVRDAILRRIVHPVVHGLAAEGMPYTGFLYVGLMLTADGPKVVEFNVRLGDPEAQVIVPMIEGDLLPVLLEAAAGRLSAKDVPLSPEPHVGVVLAAGGYPDRVETGVPIDGVEEADALPGVLVFHAGTARREGRLVTAGGRVMTVVGRGRDYREAIDRAYEGAGRIRFAGQHRRSDIGRKALAAAGGEGR